MKRLLLLLLVPIIMASSVSAGENTFFFGARYDDGFLLSYGTAIDLGHGYWSLNYANWGEPYGEVSTEVTYLTRIYKGLSLGPLLGPNADIYAGADAPTVTYVTGATGALVTYELESDKTYGNLGLWVYGKYKWSFETDNLYTDGWAVGGGIYVWW